MWSSHRFGKEAERVALHYLRRQGYRILDHNVRFVHGELDLVARKGDVIVFVEVKARRTMDQGGAMYAVTPQKERRLIKLAAQYLARHGLSDRPCRFDVILYQGDTPSLSTLQHITNAFDASGIDGCW
ncbi:MAG: YraN family protein [Nitrospirae bacterium]|nr:MAG: YraN family protein [Nitrospirota bacterium]